MKLLIDTCVLFPTVMRHALLGACKIQGWTPLWSERILEEWAHSRENWAQRVRYKRGAKSHCLRPIGPMRLSAGPPKWNAKCGCQMKMIVMFWRRHYRVRGYDRTLNARDFPRGYLREEGLDRIDPDALLMQTFLDHPNQRHSLPRTFCRLRTPFRGEWTKRALFKKARLPRFAKAIAD